MTILPRVKLHASLRHPALRSSFLEPKIHSSQLVWPVFLTSRSEDRSIGGCFDYPNQQWGKSSGYSSLIEECVSLYDMGLRHVMLFGVVDSKDDRGTFADSSDGSPVLEGLEALRSDSRLNGMSIFADVCLCEYTDHGHCGLIDKSGSIDNTSSVSRLAEIAVHYAKAGADVVCPSDMMDSRVGAIRDKLDASNNFHVQILAYTSKKASVMYAPFRHAVESNFKGSRDTYQHPIGAARLAMRALERDLQEGADMVLVKPALFYTDIIQSYSKSANVPIAAYIVSGEYKMLNDYAGNKDGQLLSQVAREAHISLARAGANVLISYFTPWILRNRLLDKWNEGSW